MSKARSLADLGNVYDDGALSNRNLIINGAMQVAQRATSSTSGGYVSLDRWYVNQSGGSTTFSQETNANPSETNGLQKYARLNVSSSSDYTCIYQRIEDVTTVLSGTITVSFYAKGTAPVGGLHVWFTQNFGSGGSADVDFTAGQITASLTSSWVRYTIQVTVPSIDGKTIGTGSFFQMAIGQYSNASATAYDLQITGVQLEVGDTATPFEHIPYSDQLLRCQRYYAQGGIILSDTALYRYHNTINLPCEMRAQPTISTGGIDSGSGGTMYSTFDSSGSANSKRNFYQSANNSALSNAWFAFDAEL
jgi:hypothetical protein